jgi:hypothetical protein
MTVESLYDEGAGRLVAADDRSACEAYMLDARRFVASQVAA